jgi:hypothetical protein
LRVTGKQAFGKDYQAQQGNSAKASCAKSLSLQVVNRSRKLRWQPLRQVVIGVLVRHSRRDIS